MNVYFVQYFFFFPKGGEKNMFLIVKNGANKKTLMKQARNSVKHTRFSLTMKLKI